jgi:hypothetical protein
MTDQEINFALALAIGYHSEDIWPCVLGVEVWTNDRFGKVGTIQYKWQRFDHKDPFVFAAIGKKFDAFPMRWNADGEWVSFVGSVMVNSVLHQCAETATALAVIKYCKKGES